MKLKRFFALTLCVCLAATLLTVNASAAAVSNKGLVLDKTAVNNNFGTYTLSLEAFLEAVPTDIVLVVDQSSSMKNQYAQEDGYWVYTKMSDKPAFTIDIFWDSNTYYVQDPHNPDIYHELDPYYSGFYSLIYFIKYSYTDSTGATQTVQRGDRDNLTYYSRTWQGGDAITKMDAAKTQIAELIASVKTAAQNSGLDHRIAVVGFGVGDEYQGRDFNYSNTGLYNARNFTAYDRLSTNNYKSAFKSVLTQEADITAAINALSATDNMASLHQYGLEIASKSHSEQTGTRNKVVVVITDGAPGWAGYEAASAGATSTWAGTLKDQNAIVYTINMDEDANVAGTDNLNAILRSISSTGCYHAATIFEEFDTAINAVTENLLATGLDLGVNTQIIDNLSAYFEFEGTVESGNIRLYTAECTGKSGESYSFAARTQLSGDALAAYTVTPRNGTLTVKGFSFEACSGTSSENSTGEKLIIEIDVRPVAGFLGGNGVPTNLNTSGVYDDGRILAFPVPTVDVPINYNVTKTQDVTVYRGNTVSVSDLYTIPAVGGIYNDFVDIEYMVNGQTVTVESDDTLDLSQFNVLSPDSCLGYPLTCTVTPTETGIVATAEINPEVATVHVLNPNLDGTDVTIWQGNSTTLAAITDWKCTCAETAKTPADVTAGLATLNATTPVFTEKGKTEAVTTVSPADCTQYTVAFTANDIPYTNDFWVHVLTASITVDDTKIYLSESVTVDDVKELDHYSWETSCGHDNVPEMTETEKNAQKTPEPSFATVTPTNCGEHKAYLKIGTITYTTSDTFTIHVLKPTVKTVGTTIFLGDDAKLTGSVASWACDRQVCNNIQSGSKNVDIEDDITWEFVKVDDNKVTTDKVTDEKLTKCTPTVAVGTLYGQKFTSAPVMVHVVLPTVTGTEATIKMGNPAPLAATTEWGNKTCECGDASKPKPEPEYPLGSKFYDGATPVTDTSYPNDCHVYTAKAVVDGVEYRFVYHDFMIHVQTPEVTGKTDTIYQGQDYDLTSTVTWKKCAHDKALTNDSEQDPAATTTYQIKNSEGSFINAGTKANYDACSDYKVTYQLTNVPNSFTGEFTVHVLIPTFTVETQDLWADLGTNVTLFTTAADDVDAVKSVSVSSWKYAGTCNEGHSDEQPTNAPEVPVTKVEFDKGEIAEIKEQDVPVTANKVSYTMYGKSYTAESDRLAGSLTAKLHANTFILKVVNGSAQNGIFTLKQGETKLYDVAVPGNSDTTTIAGLYCTKSYNLEETTGNTWSWRYNNAVKSTAVSHQNQDAVATTNCDAEVVVTVNYGDTQDNAKWLSGEDYAINKIDPETKHPVVIPEDRRKKEEEGNE